MPVGGRLPEGDGGVEGEMLGLAPGLSEGVLVGVTEGVGDAEGQSGSYASAALVMLWKVVTVPQAAVKPQIADAAPRDACKLMAALRWLRSPPLGVLFTYISELHASYSTEPVHPVTTPVNSTVLGPGNAVVEGRGASMPMGGEQRFPGVQASP